ncbi:hypothetical protein [Cyclobacterium qasimii]|uniref:Uncharacterized protein n=2 Tax=Cyclobacterium qasimii TaxID=1350429 RepID=S7WY41_9BACT|nr:hypothetical protein [Cyclobacterium qasimii]EPR71674.1 hypothetical protein ADICYQ_0145 [Cyclobacterium qasimii M12-11B]GEO22420.1 hypothetical protein CQA01_29540 [Cyclobacterium qasimii]
MKIDKKFNQLSKEEYFYFIDNYKKYSDFNTLGLYRSICENENLELNDQIEIRDHANTVFEKTFNFYQLKDPKTYFDLTTLGLELTVADERQIWSDIRVNQEKILSDKKIKHRNFGEYSKHNCGHEDCPYNGIMIKQGSSLAENSMHFKSDKNEVSAKKKSQRFKKQRKNKHQIIQDGFDD